MPGHLYLVGTPIGHLGDVSARAKETLARVSHIYAEDTRHTRALLSHLGIDGKKLLSLHAHSTERTLETALEILMEGSEVALVTDAGMPSVSDPGADLVRAAREASLPVSVVPGPSAVTAAVALSGLVDGPFSFLGFLPRKGRARDEALHLIARSTLPTVLFESPHRMSRTLADLRQCCGPVRRVAVCREMTKRFEETRLASLDELAAQADDQWRGECTLVVERSAHQEPDDSNFDLDAHIRSSLAQGDSVRDVTESVGRDLARRGQRLRRRDIYARVLALSQSDPTPSTPPQSSAESSSAESSSAEPLTPGNQHPTDDDPERP